MPAIAQMIDLINIGISLNSSFVDMVANAKEFYEAFETDVGDVRRRNSEQRGRQADINEFPRADNKVSKLAGELTRMIKSYYENMILYANLNEMDDDVLPGDFEVIRQFRNFAEHSEGGTHIPMCYIPTDKETETIWDLGLDLAAIPDSVGQLSRRRDGKYLDTLINLSQNKDGTINLSQPIDVAIHDALSDHVITSDAITSKIENSVEKLGAAIAAAQEEGNIALESILQLYIERDELRMSLAEDARKLAEAFPEIQIHKRNN